MRKYIVRIVSRECDRWFAEVWLDRGRFRWRQFLWSTMEPTEDEVRTAVSKFIKSDAARFTCEPKDYTYSEVV